jgi:mercuric ion transport protein
MKNLIKQFSGLLGAGLAAACCLGISAVLAAAGAVGLGFLIHDAYLFPLFVGFVGLSLWLLYRAARTHGRMAPFWLALAGGLGAAAGLWLLVTGTYPLGAAIYLGLGALLIGSVWDFFNARRASTAGMCAIHSNKEQPDFGRRAVNGAALAVAAAGAFYGLYKSVEVFAPKTEVGDIACYGINSCKGTTACSTASNACTGMNACKGKGYLYLPAKECALKGGVPLEQSAGNPARG